LNPTPNPQTKTPSSHSSPLRVLLFLRALRTGGSLKAALLLFRTAAFIGATLCGIIYLHGYAVRLLSV